MTKQKIKEFCNSINREFGPPFSGEGFVIDLEVTGAGTAMMRRGGLVEDLQ